MSGLLTGWFSYFNGNDPDVRTFNRGSEIYVDQTFRLMQEFPHAQVGGFMITNDEHVDDELLNSHQAELIHPTGDRTLFVDPHRNRVHELYFSQFGLQARAVYTLYGLQAAHGDPDGFFRQVKLANMAMIALLLSAFVLAVNAEFGLAAAAVSFLGFAGSPWIVKYSGNLYWVVWTEFLPFVATWLLYRRQGRAQRAAFYGLLAALVGVRSLCGYEHITPVVIAPAAAVVYFELRRGAGWIRSLWNSLGVMVAGTVGFLVAIGLHAITLAHHLGSAKSALATITTRALLRTTGDQHSGERLHAIHRSDLLLALRYLNQPALSFTQGAAIPLWMILITALAAAALWWRRNGEVALSSKITALSLGCLVAAVSSFSWMVLAQGHTRYHIHLNPIVFYLPMLPMIYVLMVLMISDLWRGRSGVASQRRLGHGCS